MSKLNFNLLLLLTALYFVLFSIYSNFIREKIKKVGHLFFINTIRIGFGIILGYQYLEKIAPLDRLVPNLLDNTALIIAVIGFTLQNSIKNVIAGALLSYSGAFVIGDRITLRVRDLTGYVEDMSLRHTVIRTYTNERVIIPNALLNEEVIINNHMTEKQQSYPVMFIIPIENDIFLCKKLMCDAVKEHQDVINEEVEVLCSDVTEEGVTLKTFIWTSKIEDNFNVASEIRLNILNKMKMNGIKLNTKF